MSLSALSSRTIEAQSMPSVKVKIKKIRSHHRRLSRVRICREEMGLMRAHLGTDGARTITSRRTETSIATPTPPMIIVLPTSVSVATSRPTAAGTLVVTSAAAVTVASSAVAGRWTMTGRPRSRSGSWRDGTTGRRRARCGTRTG